MAQGRRPIQWNEVWDHFGTALPKEAIVHAWNDRTAMTRATSAGYNALNSQGWYLDHLTTEWTEMYVNDPMKGVLPNVTHLVLGGQGEMWGETVDTSDIEQTVWPRMAAIAEQLWSPSCVSPALCPCHATPSTVNCVAIVVLCIVAKSNAGGWLWFGQRDHQLPPCPRPHRGHRPRRPKCAQQLHGDRFGVSTALGLPMLAQPPWRAGCALAQRAGARGATRTRRLPRAVSQQPEHAASECVVFVRVIASYDRAVQ